MWTLFKKKQDKVNTIVWDIFMHSHTATDDNT